MTRRTMIVTGVSHGSGKANEKFVPTVLQRAGRQGADSAFMTGASSSVVESSGGIMSQHKKIERKKELDRKRRRHKKSLKLRAQEEKAATKQKK